MFVDDQLREKNRRWLDPPDPWTNYNLAREAHYSGTAAWFIQGDTFGQWKSTGSLLWLNGTRARLSFLSFSTADGFQRLSWLRKDCYFVCVIRPIRY